MSLLAEIHVALNRFARGLIKETTPPTNLSGPLLDTKMTVFLFTILFIVSVLCWHGQCFKKWTFQLIMIEYFSTIDDFYSLD
jgi:hypothetical protein